MDGNTKLFLVASADFSQRYTAIEAIKRKILKEKSTALNILTCYSKDIELKDLQERILTFSFDSQKIVVFKDAYHLSKEVKDFMVKSFKTICSFNYLIFEMEKDYTQLMRDKKIISDKFLGFILRKALRPKLSMAHKESTLEDFRSALHRNDVASALYILGKLFEAKASEKEREILGLQIVGLLVSELSYLSNSFVKQKYFDYLWQTDRAIKEKGIEPRFAIELFLSKTLVG
ncbi:MAG: hypothetical protein WCI77_09700 [Candidatus Omnitrophota bacterium]